MTILTAPQIDLEIDRLVRNEYSDLAKALFEQYLRRQIGSSDYADVIDEAITRLAATEADYDFIHRLCNRYTTRLVSQSVVDRVRAKAKSYKQVISGITFTTKYGEMYRPDSPLVLVLTHAFRNTDLEARERATLVDAAIRQHASMPVAYKYLRSLPSRMGMTVPLWEELPIGYYEIMSSIGLPGNKPAEVIRANWESLDQRQQFEVIDVFGSFLLTSGYIDLANEIPVHDISIYGGLVLRSWLHHFLATANMDAVEVIRSGKYYSDDVTLFISDLINEIVSDLTKPELDYRTLFNLITPNQTEGNKNHE